MGDERGFGSVVVHDVQVFVESPDAAGVKDDPAIVGRPARRHRTCIRGSERDTLDSAVIARVGHQLRAIVARSGTWRCGARRAAIPSAGRGRVAALRHRAPTLPRACRSPPVLRPRVVDDRPAVRGPARILVIAVVMRHAQRRAARQHPDPDLPSSRDRRDERDHPPVAGDRWPLVHADEIGETLKRHASWSRNPGAAPVRRRDGIGSSRSAHASPISRSRRRRSRCRHAGANAGSTRGCRRQRRPVRIVGQRGGDHVGERVAREWRAAGEHLEQHAPECPDVGAFVHRPARAPARGSCMPGVPRITPARVPCAEAVTARRWRPDETAALRRLGDAEVEHLDRAVGSDLDVRRLEIAMDDAPLVRGFERIGDLSRDRQIASSSGSAPCASRSASVGPFDELEHQSAHALEQLVVDAVDRADVR